MDWSWSGTAAAEDALNVGARNLYNTAGLDRHRWTILGFDAGSPRGRAYVIVYALDTALRGVTSHEDLKKLAESEGQSLPVTRFHIPWDSGFGDFIDQHFKAFAVSLTVQSMLDVKLRVVDEQEIPDSR